VRRPGEGTKKALTTQPDAVPTAGPSTQKHGTARPVQPLSRLQTWLDALDARQPAADRHMLLALAIAMAAFSVFPLANVLLGRFAMDYDLWYFTAQNYLHHRLIYPGNTELSFIYPPSAAAMLAVPAAFGKSALALLLLLLNSLAWLASVVLTVWLVTGRVARQHPLLTLLPTLAMVFWIWDTYLLGQPALVLLALMVAAAACMRCKRPALAGVLIGTATAIKAYPVLAIGYLVYRRHWKATAALLVTLAGWLLAVPLVFRSPAAAVDDLTIWTRRVVLTYGENGISQRAVRSFSYRNQSIVGVANRLLRPVPADGEADPSWKVNVASFGFGTVNAIVVATMLSLGAFFLWCLPRGPARTTRAESIEWAMVLLLITLVPPLSWNYSFVWMLYPFGVATKLVLESAPGSPARRQDLAWLAASLGVQATALPMGHVAQAYGNILFSAGILLLGLGLALRRVTTESQNLHVGQDYEEPTTSARV